LQVNQITLITDTSKISIGIKVTKDRLYAKIKKLNPFCIYKQRDKLNLIKKRTGVIYFIYRNTLFYLLIKNKYLSLHNSSDDIMI
jgi:hypothetical protein